MVDVFAAGAATLAEASMEMPSIEDFLPPEILFEGCLLYTSDAADD